MRLLPFPIVVSFFLALVDLRGEEIPLRLQSEANPVGWRVLSYGKGKQNVVSEQSQGLKIAVDDSAGLMIFGFHQVKRYSGIRFQSLVDDLVKIKPRKRQGSRGADDYVLRVGLIFTGNRKLSAMEKRLAPAWVKELVGLYPEGYGIGGLRLYNVENGRGSGWTRRIHPSGRGLVEERRVLLLKNPGKIDPQITFENPLEVCGLWISCDGDDTDSNFNVLISQIEMIP